MYTPSTFYMNSVDWTLKAYTTGVIKKVASVYNLSIHPSVHKETIFRKHTVQKYMDIFISRTTNKTLQKGLMPGLVMDGIAAI